MSAPRRSVPPRRCHSRHLLRASSAALIGLTLAVASCALGPRYARPAVAAPAQWSTTEAASAPDGLSTEWWHSYGSPELDALMERARSANDDIGAAIARVREADAQRRIAGAGLLPTLTAGGTAVRERAPVSSGGFRTYDQYIPLATIGYELDFWGRKRAALVAAKATAAASRYDRVTVELTVMSGVATTYFLSLELRDRIAIAEANLASANRILHGLRLEREVGTATALDVAQQETVVATLSAAIPPLRQQLRQAVDALAILVGSTPDAVAPGSGSLEALTAPSVSPGLPSELLARRPDVAQAEAQLVAANADVAAARAAFFPSISLTATGGYESSALASLLTPASRIWSLGGAVTQPIFEGGALRGQSEYAKARYAELLSGYHKAVISAFANAEDALSGVRQTSDQLEREQLAVAQARRAYDIARAQLDAGTINVLALLNTEMALFNARDARAQVAFARLQASVDLFKALGGGWSDGATAGRSP